MTERMEGTFLTRIQQHGGLAAIAAAEREKALRDQPAPAINRLTDDEIDRMVLDAIEHFGDVASWTQIKKRTRFSESRLSDALFRLRVEQRFIARRDSKTKTLRFGHETMPEPEFFIIRQK